MDFPSQSHAISKQSKNKQKKKRKPYIVFKTIPDGCWAAANTDPLLSKAPSFWVSNHSYKQFLKDNELCAKVSKHTRTEEP